MIQTKQLDVNLLEAEFYENPFYFSFSSLNTLLTAPRAFHQEYVLKQKEDEFKKYLIEGILIHYLVLENQGFDDKFLVLSDNLPSENTVSIITRIYTDHYLTQGNPLLRLSDFENEVDALLTAVNLHQNVKDRDKRLAKVIEPKAEAYFDFLKQRKNKTIIDGELLDRATKRAEIVKGNPEIRSLLGLDIVSDGRLFGVYNELEIKLEAAEAGLPFGFKGTLDNVVVDVRRKCIRINDFKTTGKSLVDFNESVEFWNYWLQAAMYVTLVKHFFRQILTDEWVIEFRFLVFDKYDQLYPFEVTPGTLLDWLESFETVKKEALYHYESKDYSLPYDFALGNIKL